MKTFSEILSSMANADHVKCIALFHSDGSEAGLIENKLGSQGSIKVYHHLLQKWGSINVEAAREGLEIYSEHTADAQSNFGKHPNIDLLLNVVASGNPLKATVSKNC